MTTQPAVRPRVLLIDDEALLLRSLGASLERSCEVILALGGAEGLEVLSRDAGFDLVVCDLGMPEVSGLQVAETIARQHPHLRTRVLYITGGTLTARFGAFAGGLPDHQLLEKPFGPDALRAAVRRALEEARKLS